MAIRGIRKRNRPTFKDQGESFGKAFDKSLSAIDPKVKDKEEPNKNVSDGTSDNKIANTETQSVEDQNFLKGIDWTKVIKGF